MTERVLIRGGTVLSMDRSVGNMATGDVLIEAGTITEVGSKLRARNAETIDASDCIVMPGFVDTHRHVWHALFRHAAVSQWPNGVSDFGPHFGADHVYAATLVGLLGAVEAGITTVVDWADIPKDLPATEAALQAHADAGLRTVFVMSAPGWEDHPLDPEWVRATITRHTSAGVTFALCPGEPGDVDRTAGDWATARAEGIRIYTHAGSDPNARGVVARLGASGLLGDDVTLILGPHLDGGDLDAIVSARATVSLAPVADMTSGRGTPPLQQLIDRRIRPGLGIGSEMESPGDMFAQMRAANSVQHATLFDLKLAGKGGVPNLLTTRDVIRYATIDGAVATGLDGAIGSLTPGKRGDVIVLRTDRPNIAPVNDPIGAVVWGMDTSNIHWVLVGGRALVRDGSPTADVARARKLAAEAQMEVASASGALSRAVEPT